MAHLLSQDCWLWPCMRGFCRLINLIQLVNQPIRISDNLEHHSYLLDLFLTSDKKLWCWSGVPTRLPVSFRLPVYSLTVPPIRNLTKWHYNSCDWEGLQTIIIDIPWASFFSNDVNFTLEHIQDFIKTGMDIHSYEENNKRSDSPKWFDYNCARTIKQSTCLQCVQEVKNSWII